jgi:FkbM family methyltransferase
VTPLRHRLARVGINRSALIRRMVILGHPRLRAWDARVAGSPVLRTALAPAARWLNHAPIVVPSGLGHGLRLSKVDLPLSHAHLGSLAYGNLEISVQEAMLRHVAPGSTFYDVGANLGFFALLAARMVGPEGRVYAWEPAPANAAAIRRNVAINGFENVVVEERAASDHSGRGRLQIVDDQSWSKLEEYGQHPGTEEILDVELVALDDVVAAGEVPPPDVVKIDVEGAEIAVLAGMEAILREHRPAVICELHETHREFVAHMSARGYRLINLEGTEPIEEGGASAHALALPA